MKDDLKYFFDKKFLKALYAEDVLGAIIRTHLYVENALIELISVNLAFPEQLDFSKITIRRSTRFNI